MSADQIAATMPPTIRRARSTARNPARRNAREQEAILHDLRAARLDQPSAASVKLAGALVMTMLQTLLWLMIGWATILTVLATWLSHELRSTGQPSSVKPPRSRW